MNQQAVSVCLPGEFEKQSALILGCDELLCHFPQLLVEIVAGLIGKIPLLLQVDGEEHRCAAVALLSDWGLSPNQVQFICVPGATMWVRDYGPSFVKTSSGKIVLVDGEYVPQIRPADDIFPQQLGSLLNLPVVAAPLMIEGGNLLSNGRGLCVTTTMLIAVNQRRGRDMASMAAVLRDRYGFRMWTYLQPLAGEPTEHVDMFTTFTAPNVAVVGRYDPAVDPRNAALLDHNAQVLAAVTTEAGPMQVVRIPMPPNRDGVFRTYTNVIYANGTLLVPTYPDVEPDFRHILDLYATLLPGWEIVPINASMIIRNRGSLRCISINVPWLEGRFLLEEPQRPQLPPRGKRAVAAGAA